MPRLGVSVRTFGVARGRGAVEAHRSAELAVEQPDRDVNALDLVYHLIGEEVVREQLFALAELFDLLLDAFLVDLERYDPVRAERSGQLFGDDDFVVAVRAVSRRRRSVGDYLRAAGFAYVHGHLR